MAFESPGTLSQGCENPRFRALTYLEDPRIQARSPQPHPKWFPTPTYVSSPRNEGVLVCSLLRTRGLNSSLAPRIQLCPPHPASCQQEGVVWIPSQGLADLLEFRGDAQGLGPRPPAATLSALLSAASAAGGPHSSCPPGHASRTAPWGAVSSSGVLQVPAASSPRA